MAKVAVITRTKDRTSLLGRAIRSIANQTYGDYVHVIVNDGGDKERIQAVIDSFDSTVRDKIKLFHRQASNAHDTILTESVDRVDSEYVAIHDDDDTWHPDMLKLAIEKLDTGAAGVSVRVDNVHEKLVNGEYHTTKTTPYMADLRAVSLYRQCIDNQMPTIGFIYRRDAYEKVGKYDSTLPVVADWEFGIRFLLENDVAYLDPGYALANYHHRESSDHSFAMHSDRENLTIVMNKYLRADLQKGKIGVGYIMNDLRYQQDMIASNVRKLLPKSLANLIRKRVR